MAVKMIATRRYYVKSESRECQAGEAFNAANEREAENLVRMKRAKRAVDRSVEKAAPVRTRAMKPRSAAGPEPEVRKDPPSEPVGAPAADAGPKDAPSDQGGLLDVGMGGNTYGRRDLRAED